ncbi:MAG: VOC family protein [Hamadaea sp.]|nr:VOC family protein [Hamadaea sp.]
MSIARYRKVCVDATDPEPIGRFWAAALGRRWQPADHGEGGVFGVTPRQTVWINLVPEVKTVKNRVHFDIYARSLADLRELGATVVLPEGDDRRWTVMADPEGNEFCAFLREELPEDRLHGLVVDSADPAAIAAWWAEVYDAPVKHEAGGSTVENVPDMPILTFDFAPVPEPKTVKNRVHWDITVRDVEQLVARGATVLTPAGDDRNWTVLADPEGNEFCAFTDVRDR